MHDALMKRYYETYNSEDPDALAQFYHPEVELVSEGGTMRGREEVMQTYRYMITTFVDRMEPSHILVDGDTVTVDIVDRLQAKTDVPDFLGTTLAEGESLTLRLRGVYQVQNGQFRHIHLRQQT